MGTFVRDMVRSVVIISCCEARPDLRSARLTVE
jgi:hypothetical protein